MRNKHFQEDANIFLVDWGVGAANLYYPSSAANTRVVGAAVAKLMGRLVDERGFDPDMLWCIGFSLGAHSCGFAGKRTKIGRIQGRTWAVLYVEAVLVHIWSGC